MLLLASYQSIPFRTEAQITQLVEKITLITESTSFCTRDGELLVVFWKDGMDAPFSSHGPTGPTGLSSVLVATIQDFEGVYPPPLPSANDKRHKDAVVDPGVSGLIGIYYLAWWYTQDQSKTLEPVISVHLIDAAYK